MRISVIIPAYNAEKHIEKAVKSVLSHENVNELIIVEDGSKDGTLNICINLQKIDKRIQLHTHPENQNLGAGASRNLGIQKSSSEFISFLDADDYYLPNRFDAEIKYVKNGVLFDGVFGALGFHYYNEKVKLKAQKTFGKIELTTVRCKTINEQTFEGLLGINKQWKGYFSLNTLTIKKESLNKLTYYFNPKLRLHQDTEFIIRYAYYNKLIPGIINEPIGFRGVHETNRITSNEVGFESRLKYYESLLQWSKKNEISLEAKNKIHAEIKYHDFFSKTPQVNILRLLIFICSDRVLFFNDRYLQLGANNVKNGTKLLNLIIRLKEKFVISFLRRKKNKNSIYVN